MKVSVIMPCNRPQDLLAALKVFHAQTYSNKELIVVTDDDEACEIKYQPYLPDGYLPVGIDSFNLHMKYRHANGAEILFHVGCGTIGNKRNVAMWAATGEIIVHQDSDDFYASDWVQKSVQHLLSGKMALTGLSRAYFSDGMNAWEYKYEGSQPYVCGATMCYWKANWSWGRFADVQVGEDLLFCVNKLIVPHDYHTGFVARIHGQNTASHKQLHTMRPADINIIRGILQNQ